MREGIAKVRNWVARVMLRAEGRGVGGLAMPTSSSAVEVSEPVASHARRSAPRKSGTC